MTNIVALTIAEKNSKSFASLKTVRFRHYYPPYWYYFKGKLGQWVKGTLELRLKLMIVFHC